MNKNIVCVTTFRQGDATHPIERIRARVFMDTAAYLAASGLPLVALYTDTTTAYLRSLQELGVILVEQEAHGMGSIRREALQAAIFRFPEANQFCWLEPEKPDLVQFIEPLGSLMRTEGAVLGLFRREEMDSYPEEQAHYYLFCRAMARHPFGVDVDYAFGPMVIERSAMRYFLDYDGSYGDQWEAILIPRLRIWSAGLGVSQLSVPFHNDPRMTEVEAGNPEMILKRLEQFNSVVSSFIQEWKRLNVASA